MSEERDDRVEQEGIKGGITNTKKFEKPYKDLILYKHPECVRIIGINLNPA